MKKNKTDRKKSGAPHKEAGFKGYTMKELRYQRALVSLKKEFLKERALNETKEIKGQLPLIGNKKSAPKAPSSPGIFSKIMKGMDFADYLVIGMQTVKIGKKIGKIFKKKKKNE